VQASKAWGGSYPLDLIAAAAERAAARFFDIRIEGHAVGSLVALRGDTDWMYWLAVQNEEGPQAEVGSFAVATMLDAARAASAKSVNLGASAGLPGVAQFTKRVGGVECPVFEWKDSSALIALADASRAFLARRLRR
jgi:hypothetical protein